MQHVVSPMHTVLQTFHVDRALKGIMASWYGTGQIVWDHQDATNSGAACTLQLIQL